MTKTDIEASITGKLSVYGLYLYIIVMLKKKQSLSKSFKLLKHFNKGLCSASLQNGEIREQFTVGVRDSARPRHGATLRSAVRASQALQEQGAPAQVTEETEEGDEVAAAGG